MVPGETNSVPVVRIDHRSGRWDSCLFFANTKKLIALARKAKPHRPLQFLQYRIHPWGARAIVLMWQYKLTIGFGIEMNDPLSRWGAPCFSYLLQRATCGGLSTKQVEKTVSALS